MPVTDTEIQDWLDDYATVDTNSPLDTGADIGGLLADEVRNIKSIIRKDSESLKGWIRKVPTADITYIGTRSFTVEGYWENEFAVGRQVQCYSAATGLPTRSIVYKREYNAGANNTLVTLLPCMTYIGSFPTDTPFWAYFPQILTVPGYWQAAGDFTATYKAGDYLVHQTADLQKTYTFRISTVNFTGVNTIMNVDIANGYSKVTPAGDVHWFHKPATSTLVPTDVDIVEYAVYSPNHIHSAHQLDTMSGAIRVVINAPVPPTVGVDFTDIEFVMAESDATERDWFPNANYELNFTFKGGTTGYTTGHARMVQVVSRTESAFTLRFWPEFLAQTWEFDFVATFMRYQ